MTCELGQTYSRDELGTMYSIIRNDWKDRAIGRNPEDPDIVHLENLQAKLLAEICHIDHQEGGLS